MYQLPPLLTEKEFHLFMKPKKKPMYLVTFLYVFLMVGILAAGFFTMNAAAYARTAPLTSTVRETATVNPISTATPQAVAQIPAATAQPTPTPAQETPSLPDNTVSYDNLNISAPIHWDTAFVDSTILTNLQTGVIHLAGTPHPGEAGMSVLFGHSSNYPWAKGDYKTIFAPLGKAKIGDSFNIQYKGVLYTYVITKKFEVSANDLSILNSPSNNSGVRLSTCTPIGTSLRRLIIEGEQSSPNPTSNTPFTQHQFSGSLPGDN